MGAKGAGKELSRNMERVLSFAHPLHRHVHTRAHMRAHPWLTLQPWVSVATKTEAEHRDILRFTLRTDSPVKSSQIFGTRN